MLDNQLILEIAKYLHNTTKIPQNTKLYQAFTSHENISKKFAINQHKLAKKICNREILDELVRRNIYKDRNYTFNFSKIHNELDKILKSGRRVKTDFLIVKVSDNIAYLAKTLDFNLKKKILKHHFKKCNRE